MQALQLLISSDAIRARAGRLTRGLTLLAVAAIAFGCGDSEDVEDWEDGDAAFFLEEAMPEAAEGYENFGDFPVDVAAPPFGAFPPDSLGYAGEFDDDSEEFESGDAGGFAFGEDEYDGGYDVGTGANQGGGWGGDANAFRGEAEVGGVPQVSGTVDPSGEGNHVFSVGGKVIELP